MNNMVHLLLRNMVLLLLLRHFLRFMSILPFMSRLPFYHLSFILMPILLLIPLLQPPSYPMLHHKHILLIIPFVQQPSYPMPLHKHILLLLQHPSYPMPHLKQSQNPT